MLVGFSFPKKWMRLQYKMRLLGLVENRMLMNDDLIIKKMKSKQSMTHAYLESEMCKEQGKNVRRTCIQYEQNRQSMR